MKHSHRWFGEAPLTGELACANCGKTITEFAEDHASALAALSAIVAIRTWDNPQEPERSVAALEGARAVLAKMLDGGCQ